MLQKYRQRQNVQQKNVLQRDNIIQNLNIVEQCKHVYLCRPLCKNYIAFRKDTTLYYTNLIGDLVTDALNRNMMNLFLERYEQDLNLFVTYDDIEIISLYENHNEVIRDLPNSLRILDIMNSVCTRMELSEANKEKIEMIFFCKTNMDMIPDIGECRKLKTLKINQSNLSNFNQELPFCLKELNFDRNLLKNEEFHFEKIQPFIVEQDNTKKFKLSLNDNYFNRDEIPMEYKNWCYLLRQGTYVFQRVNFYNVHEDNIRNQVFQIHLEINGIETVEKVKNVLKGNGQTVHISSINRSVVNSIEFLKEYCKINKYNIEKLDITLISQDCTIQNNQKEFNNFIQRKPYLKSFLIEHFELEAKHSIMHLTYKELFELVWTVIINHKEKSDLLERLKYELEDSFEMCFTGCMNRLINSLVGFVDGVKVSISYKEEIQMSIQRSLEKINNFIEENPKQGNNLSKEDIHKKLQEFMFNIRELFVDIPIDIIENEKITPEYGQSWMENIVELYESHFEKYMIEWNNEKEAEILWTDDVVWFDVEQKILMKIGKRNENGEISFFQEPFSPMGLFITL